MATQILVADDHPIIRSGIRNLVDATDDLVVGGEAHDKDSALAKLRGHDWGLLVLDLTMPGANGVELIVQARAEHPKLPILVFSGQQEERYAVCAMRSGASGYLTKGADIDLLIPAMRKVAAGGIFVSQKTAALLVADYARPTDQLPHTLLTPREGEVFRLIIGGLTMTEIANRLSLSIKTVSTHKAHIFKRLKVSSQVDLARYAILHGLIEP